MPYMNLWGVNPQSKKPEAYIGHVPKEEKSEWEEKARTEGWTQLTWGTWEPSMEAQDDTPE